MKNNSPIRPILLLNLAMLCISTSGMLGRYVSMPPPLTIWWRAFFAIFCLGIFCLWKNYTFRFDRKKYGKIFFISGALMAIHWVTYFYALHLSNVAIGMLSLFTYPVMTALLEPVMLKTKFEKHHLLSSLLVLVGIYFLAPELNFSNAMTQGLLMGLISALCYSVRNILLKTQVTTFNGSVLMFYQMVITTVLVFPVLFFYDQILDYSQVPYILFLSLITTAVGHTLFLNSFKFFSVSTASILSGLQPIYGIVLAIFFLGEIPNWSSWIGGSLILLTVVLESRLNLRAKK
ncbi:MAG: DMT family transporter [Bacteroidota bacterium]